MARLQSPALWTAATHLCEALNVRVGPRPSFGGSRNNGKPRRLPGFSFFSPYRRPPSIPHRPPTHRAPRGMMMLPTLWFKSLRILMSGYTQTVTNGNRGGKLPIGKIAFRSPAFSFSAASRNAATKLT